MIALEFKFIAGTYHATPWHENVQEGGVEWPPSPWRVLRAIIASWYTIGQIGSEQTAIDSSAQRLSVILDKLCEPPRYLLPQATLGHSRHYMPTNGKPSLVIDAFVTVPKDKPLIIYWDNVELTDSEKAMLGALVSNIHYLGRAESWVEASLADNTAASRIREDKTYFESFIAASDTNVNSTRPLVKLLGCMNEQEYSKWMKDNVNNFQGLALPQSFFDALQAQTSRLKKEGWNRPPGSKVLTYLLPGKEKALRIIPVRSIKPIKNNPTIARFVIASAVRPNIKYSLSLAERVHTSLVKLSNKEPVFTGCDSYGNPMRDGHKQAHIFCEPISERLSQRRTIGYITIYAKHGFNERARHALENLRRVWGYGGHDIRLMLLGIGNEEDFRDSVPLLSFSDSWIYATPFVPTRHPKLTRAGKPRLDSENGLQIGSPEHDLRRLLKCSGFVPSQVKLRKPDPKFSGFTIERKTGGGIRAGNTGYYAELKFDKQVCGPIAVGYGSHFGLGLFVPSKQA